MNILTEIRNKKEDLYKIFDDASSSSDIDILQTAESRKKTDKVFLKVFAASVALLVPFLIYTLCYSDINRLKGYDECGNICGQKNVKYEQWNCTGQDMTLKPIFSTGYGCIENKDVLQGFLSEETMFNFFHKAAWKILLVSFFSLALCLVLIVLFRYAPAVAVWSILVLLWMFIMLIGLLTIDLPAVAGVTKPIYAIIALLLLVLWVLVNLKKARLIAIVLKEATCATFKVKKMYYVSLGTLLGLLIILIVYIIITFHMVTAGKLTELYAGRLIYIGDNIKLVTMILNTVITFWAILFVIGIHDMIVGGVIAKWYIIKNQDSLNDAVAISVHNTLNYHLGTVALGSILVTILFIPVTIILKVLPKLMLIKEKADLWLKYLDGFCGSYSYLITAMYGTSFVQSGKKAVKLLKLSIGNTIDLISFGDFIIMVGQGLVICISTVGVYITLYDETGSYGTYIICFTFVQFGIATICAFTMMGPIKIASNTIFLCATEEFLKNKEVDLPYTMTMKELVDGSNKLYVQKIQSMPPSIIEKTSIYKKVSFFIFVGVSCILFVFAFSI